MSTDNVPEPGKVNNGNVNRSLLLTAALVPILCTQPSASPVGSFDVRALCSKADLIVVGAIIKVAEVKRTTIEMRGMAQPVSIRNAEIRVDGVIKGELPTGTTSFRFVIPQLASMGYSGVDANTYRVMFLKSTNDGLAILDPTYPSAVAAPGLQISNKTATEEVIAQIAHVLSTGSTTVQDKHAAIQLLTENNAVANHALRTMLRDADESLRLDALAALLRRNDTSVLPLAKRTILHPPRSVPDYFVGNVIAAISSGIKDPRAIPVLAQLLEAQNAEARRAAAFALRNTGSPFALAPLTRALTDMDFEVRYYAVIGFGEIVGEPEFRPLEETFKSNQTRYLSHWREWAAKNLQSEQAQIEQSEKFAQSPSNPYFVDCGKKSAERSHAAKSAVIASPIGDLAVAETRANWNGSSCSNTATLRLRNKGGEWRTVFMQEPEEMNLGNGIRIIDWSAHGRYLLFEVLQWQYGSDAGTTNTIWVYDRIGYFKQIPFPAFQAHGCFVTIEPLGFATERVVVMSLSAKQYFDEEGERDPETCKEGVSYWWFDVVSNSMKRGDTVPIIRKHGRSLNAR